MLYSRLLKYNLACTGCPKSHTPYLTRYSLRYENSTAIKEVFLDRLTLHNFCDIKHDPIDDFLYEIPGKYRSFKEILKTTITPGLTQYSGNLMCL